MRGNAGAGTALAFLETLDGIVALCRAYPRASAELRSLRGEAQRLRQQVAPFGAGIRRISPSPSPFAKRAFMAPMSLKAARSRRCAPMGFARLAKDAWRASSETRTPTVVAWLRERRVSASTRRGACGTARGQDLRGPAPRQRPAHAVGIEAEDRAEADEGVRPRAVVDPRRPSERTSSRWTSCSASSTRLGLLGTRWCPEARWYRPAILVRHEVQSTARNQWPKRRWLVLN